MLNKRSFPLLISSIAIAIALYAIFQKPVEVGECYILDGGAWKDKVIQITKVGKYGALAKDAEGSTYRIRKSARKYERIDCFDLF